MKRPDVDRMLMELVRVLLPKENELRKEVETYLEQNRVELTRRGLVPPRCGRRICQRCGREMECYVMPNGEAFCMPCRRNTKNERGGYT